PRVVGGIDGNVTIASHVADTLQLRCRQAVIHRHLHREALAGGPGEREGYLLAPGPHSGFSAGRRGGRGHANRCKTRGAGPSCGPTCRRPGCGCIGTKAANPARSAALPRRPGWR
nr:hypothetical protein [Tanacetum cinerariifolium]